MEVSGAGVCTESQHYSKASIYLLMLNELYHLNNVESIVQMFSLYDCLYFVASHQPQLVYYKSNEQENNDFKKKARKLGCSWYVLSVGGNETWIIMLFQTVYLD